MTYSEGWPKTTPIVEFEDPRAAPWGLKREKVVPFSDAERMREALQWIADADQLKPSLMADRARIALAITLNPEQGK